MAKIKATQLEPNKYGFEITNLSTTWKGSDRRCVWYWNSVTKTYPTDTKYDGGPFETYIEGSPSSSYELNLSDLSYNTTYWITVYIYGVPPTHVAESLLTTLHAKITTNPEGYVWYFECDGYDYNGELFIHGKIDCDISVSHVVITATNEFNRQYRYKSYLDTVNLPNVFNMRTGTDGIDSAPQILPCGIYTFNIKLYRANGEVIGDADVYTLSSNGTTDVLWEYEMCNYLDSPALSYDSNTKTITVKNQGYGRYFLEIRRQNRNKVNTGYTQQEKDYFYDILMRGTEEGKYNEGAPPLSQCGIYDSYGNLLEPVPIVRQYSIRDLKTIILFDRQANLTDSEKNSYYNIVCNMLDYATLKTGFIFSDRTVVTRLADNNRANCQSNDHAKYYADGYRLIIRLGMGDIISPNRSFAGTWSCYTSGYNINSSYINIAIDFAEEWGRLKHTILHEIIQCLGMGNNGYLYEQSIHWNSGFSSVEKLSDIDVAINNLYFQRNIGGWSAFDLLNQYDTPCLLFQDYAGEDLVFDVSDLNENEIFYAEAWVVEYVDGHGPGSYDNDLYSPRSQIMFDTYVNSSRPKQFKWTYPKRKGGEFNLTADEFNGFIDHVNDMLEYKGYSTFYYPKINPGTQFLRWDYNTVLNEIKSMGYGMSIPEVGYKTPITADITSSDPSKNNINVIVDAVNAIPANEE